MAAVEDVLCAIVAHDDYEKSECEGPDSKVDEGVLVALMKFVLGKHGVSQRYWNGALVGPDCRRLLEHHTTLRSSRTSAGAWRRRASARRRRWTSWISTRPYHAAGGRG